MATLTNKRRQEIEAVRMKILRGEIQRIAKQQGRTLSNVEIDKQVANFEAYRNTTKQIESSGDYKAKNKSIGGTKPTSARGAYQFLQGSVDPAYNRLKRLVGDIPEFKELLKHKDASKMDPALQDLLFTADILQKNIQDATGKKKPGEGDRLLRGVFQGDKRAARDLYIQGWHTDINNKEVRDYANRGFGVKSAEQLATEQGRRDVARSNILGAANAAIPPAQDSPTAADIAQYQKYQKNRAGIANLNQAPAPAPAPAVSTPTAPLQYSPENVASLAQTLPFVTEQGRRDAARSNRLGAANAAIPPAQDSPTAPVPYLNYQQNLAAIEASGLNPLDASTVTAPRPAPIIDDSYARAIEAARARKYRSGLGYAQADRRFARGGMVNSAEGLASLGRGPDTELVHMSPREVGALDTLARRNGLDGLPTNPQTGLPEAGIFEAVLPMLVGAGAAAAAPFTGGGSLAAFLASPLAVGGTAALGAGIASGFDAAQMAKWGLGVYGGANLAGSLASAGSAAPAQEAAKTAAAQETTRQAAQESALAGVTQAKATAVQTQEQILKELIAEQTKDAAKRQAITLEAGKAAGRTSAQIGASVPSYVADPAALQSLAAKEAGQQQLAKEAAVQAAQQKLYNVPIDPITSQFTGLSPAEAGEAFRQTTTGSFSDAPFGSGFLGEAAREAGKQQFGAMGKALSTEAGRGALVGSGTGADKIAGTLGKAPFYTGVGSLAADHYIRQRDFEPDPPPEKEKPFYPEGGFLPPPRRSVNPFAGEQFISDTGEGLYFDPEPFTSPGYTYPGYNYREGGLVSLNKGGNVPAPSMAVPIPDAGESAYFDPSRMTALVAGPQAQTNADAFVRMGEGVPIDEWANFSQADKKRYKLNHDTLDMNLIEPKRAKFWGIDFSKALRGLPHMREQSPLTDTNKYVPRQATGISATLPVGINPDAQEMTYFNQGGLLRGVGDGMSDDIMLPINGSRDIAAVSPDEFVVSADVVAGLGNGSTSAGAKQLYGMMDRVRKARTGKKSQPRAIDANKMMPA
tara:strand:- start:10112 stop:13204 length:3093 start_codon:yes stop_codon:yes gene_type:complete